MATKGLTAGDVMNPEVLLVREDMTVHEVADFLVGSEISGAPVVTAEGDLVGVVSLADIALAVSERGGMALDRSDPGYFVRGWEESLDTEDLRHLHIEGEGVMVRDVMTSTYVSVSEETPIADVAKAMISGHYHRILVVSRGKLVGIITTMDLLGLLAEEQ